MRSKADIRKSLTDGVAAFLANGKTITKLKEKTSKRLYEEKNIEIEVQHLPLSLKNKFFKES
jgi:hypothetical protein